MIALSGMNFQNSGSIQNNVISIVRQNNQGLNYLLTVTMVYKMINTIFNNLGQFVIPFYNRNLITSGFNFIEITNIKGNILQLKIENIPVSIEINPDLDIQYSFVATQSNNNGQIVRNFNFSDNQGNSVVFSYNNGLYININGVNNVIDITGSEIVINPGKYYKIDTNQIFIGLVQNNNLTLFSK